MMSTSPPKAPRLTIVIPTLNRAHLVARAVESALAQTSPEIEIIVSDNGSADETPAVLNRYSDPRLRRLRRETTVPAAAHGNILLTHARGEFFLGLSDDDYIEPDFAARVFELLDRRPNLAFVYTGCLIHYGPVPVAARVGPEVERGPDFIASFLAGRRDVCWCACVTRLADLKAIGQIPEGRIFGDMFYWTKLAFLGDVGCVSAPLSHYTFMTDNVSSATPVCDWASETRMLADEVLAAYARSGADRGSVAALRRESTRFVARSTANQCIWNAIHGRDRRTLLKDMVECWRSYVGDPATWPRVASALVLPRHVLKRLILGAAARRARVRSME